MGIFSDYLLVSDFDLTITDQEDRVPPANLQAVADFVAQGGAFTVATGRSVPMALSRLRDFPLTAPLITFNGAVCSEPTTGECLWSEPLPADYVDLFRPYQSQDGPYCLELQALEGHYVFHHDDHREQYLLRHQVPVLRAPWDQVPGPVYKLSLYTPGKRLFATAYGSETALYFERLAREFRTLGGGRYDAINSRPGIVEVQSAACSKGKSARRLASLLGRRVLVCVGDSMNDLSMLEEADLGFCTGDCDPSLPRPGLRQTVPCGEGALAGVIEQLMAETR